MPGAQAGAMPGMVPVMMMPNPLMVATAAQDKVNRELFVGNTPPGTSEALLTQFLNGAMRRTK
eukprot:12796977-Ditylum_brightwellii.AAC.1